MATFGFIGVGNMGGAHVFSLGKIENAQVTALCDLNPEKLKPFQNHGARLFDSDEAFFEQSDVDAVVVVPSLEEQAERPVASEELEEAPVSEQPPPEKAERAAKAASLSIRRREPSPARAVKALSMTRRRASSPSPVWERSIWILKRES